MPNDLNLQLSQRVSVALVFVMLAMAMLLAVYWHGYFLTPLFALVFFLLSRYWVDGTGADTRPKSVIATMTVALGTIVALAYRFDMLMLIPPVLLGYILLFLKHRYSRADKRSSKVIGVFLGMYLLAMVALVLTYLPGNIFVFAFFAVVLLLVVLNGQFYIFLAGKRGRMFAMAAIPFHLLYHLYNGISFSIGLARHSWRSLQHRFLQQRKPVLSDDRG